MHIYCIYDGYGDTAWLSHNTYMHFVYSTVEQNPEILTSNEIVQVRIL